MLQSTTVLEICKDLPFFGYSSLVKSSFPWYSSSMNLMELEYHKNIPGKFEVYIFKELEFLELEFYDKLKFQKSKVVDPYIISKQ